MRLSEDFMRNIPTIWGKNDRAVGITAVFALKEAAGQAHGMSETQKMKVALQIGLIVGLHSEDTFENLVTSLREYDIV